MKRRIDHSDAARNVLCTMEVGMRFLGTLDINVIRPEPQNAFTKSTQVSDVYLSSKETGRNLLGLGVHSPRMEHPRAIIVD